MNRLAACLVFGLLAATAFAQDPPAKPFGKLNESEKAAAVKKVGEEQAALGLGVLIAIGVGSFVMTILPSIVAMIRGHNNQVPIFLLCLFLGWTCIGWIVAMIWAFSDNTAESDNWKYRRR